jgi:D-sedoheptulose 7-phosphate isomerase
MNKRLAYCVERHPALAVCVDDMIKTHDALVNMYRKGGQLLICGNGGSAADADHISGELLKGFGSKRPLQNHWKGVLGDELHAGLQGALPALPLPCFGSLFTAFCNDCHPDHTYAQLVWGLGRPGDALLCISTSGNAKNVLHAAKVAKAKGLITIGFTGETGGELLPLVDIAVRAPSRWTPDIQEYQLPLYHALCLMLEDTFFGEFL